MILTNAELDNFLISTINQVDSKYFPKAKIVFDTLYQHGFRIGELEELHNWQITIDGNILAPTLKNGSIRKVSSSEVHQIIIDSILASQNYLYLSSYNFYDQLFQTNKPSLSLSAGKKELSTHSFRHNVIKKLSDAGQTLEQIRLTMGIKHTSIVSGYIGSEITAIY